MQLKTLIFAVLASVAFAAPAVDATEDLDLVNSGFLTAADLQYCGDFRHRYERRECREERHECRRWG
jgi:hypothetical protein